jgi:hypothetical protein
MKSLFITLLILGLAFLAYDYFLAPPWERLVFERAAKPKADAGPTLTRHVVEDDGPVTAPAAPKAAPTADRLTLPALPGDFVPPALASLEELTKNWSVVPPQAFPRQVKLHQPVDVKMSMGSARIQAGATAYAYAVEDGMVSVAPTDTSTARGAIPIMDTDLPDQLRQSYDKWKTARVEQARKAWLARKTAKPGANVTINDPVDLSRALDPAGKPVRAGDGTYPLLLASMKNGDVTDITLPRVRRWGEVETQMIDGQPAWTVDVWYETMAFCGPMEARAQAQVRNGRVIAWIYPGSGEPVP